MITRDLTRRVEAAADRLASINNAAGGAKLTGGQQRDFASVAGDIVAAGDEIRAVDKYAAEMYDGLAAQLASGDHDGAAHQASILSEHVERMRLAAAADGARAKFAPVFERGAERSSAIQNDLADAISDVVNRGQNRVMEIALPSYEERATWTTSGGSAVQTDFASSYVEYLRNVSPWFAAPASVVRTQQGNPMVFPTLTADATVSSWTAENSAIGTANPTFSPTTINIYKLADLQQFSVELEQDAVFAIQPILARSAARSIGITAGQSFTAGTGTVEPTGVLGYAAGTSTATASLASATFFDQDDLATLYGSAPVSAQNSGVWFMAPTAFTKVLKLKDVNEAPIFQPGSIAGAAPGTIYGRPVYIDPGLTAVGSATVSVFFGDVSAYTIREAGNLRVELSRDWAFSSDLLTLKVAARYGGALLDSGAIKVLKNANA